MTPLVAAAAVAAAVCLASRSVGSARLRGLTPPTGKPPGGGESGPVLTSLAGALAGLVLTGGLLAAAAGGAVSWLVHRGWARSRAEREAQRLREALPDVLRLLGAELQAGAAPHEALRAAAESAPAGLGEHLKTVAAGVRLGLPAYEMLPTGPAGTGALAALAVCWQVSASAGAGLADGVSRLAAGLAAELRGRAEVEAALAGPRASAAVLAALPVLAVLLGAGLGAAPAEFFRTRPGALCLLLGVGLDLAGLAWTRRIASSALR